jgi:hypothetical protein
MEKSQTIEMLHDHMAINSHVGSTAGTIKYFYMRMNSIPQGKEILLFCHLTSLPVIHMIMQNLY